MKAGTMVMLRAPAEEIAKWMDTAPRNGACGEVMNTEGTLECLENGQVGVLFPSHPSPYSSKGWAIFSKWLLPLSDPDADMGENESVVKGKITEDLV